MPRGPTRNQRFIFLFLIGYVLFNYPLLSLFDLPRAVWGIPILYGYLFSVWALLIILAGITVGSRPDRSAPKHETERRDEPPSAV